MNKELHFSYAVKFMMKIADTSKDDDKMKIIMGVKVKESRKAVCITVT